MSNNDRYKLNDMGAGRCEMCDEDEMDGGRCYYCGHRVYNLPCDCRGCLEERGEEGGHQEEKP